MALTINFPKNVLLRPLFILFVIILAPFALFFSLARIPFAKRRVVKLNEIINSDWIPRQKYIYLSWSDDFPLADFVENTVVGRFKPNVIFDKWSAMDNEWTENEPDTYSRVTAFLQDIAGEFDGVPNLLVATVDPKDPSFSTEGTKNMLFFCPSEEGYVSQWGNEMTIEKAKKLVTTTIQANLEEWDKLSEIRNSKDEMNEIREKVAIFKARTPKEIVQAHTHSSSHREEILRSNKCGCFYCLRVFKPSKIKEWIDDGTCAMCPMCGIDSVIGDASGFPPTKEFLGQMRRYWFDT